QTFLGQLLHELTETFTIPVCATDDIGRWNPHIREGQFASVLTVSTKFFKYAATGKSFKTVCFRHDQRNNFTTRLFDGPGENHAQIGLASVRDDGRGSVAHHVIDTGGPGRSDRL